MFLVSLVTKALPNFRGLRKAYRCLNSLLLKCGHSPIAIATIKDGTSIKVDLRSNTEVDAYYRGEYDSIQIETIKKLLNPDYHFLDIGANIGFYSIAIGSYTRSKNGLGKVYAFEPYETNYERLLENIALNNLSDYCVVTKTGLSDISTESLVVLRDDFRNGASTGNTSIPINDQFDKGLMKAPVKLELLDNLWRTTNNKIDFIKIDIEGHEDYCLRGAKETISKYRPMILMEINKPYYIARGVELDTTLLPLLPERYSIFKFEKTGWNKIFSLNECQTIDNVLLIPEEKEIFPL